VTDEKPEEETYSLIYTSLKHPIRRRILRMLKNKPLTFSEMLEAVDIDSGHLNYHLESLGELITHSQDGKYELSSVGSAAVKLMGGVEEHSHELSKPKLKLTRILAKAYPLILSGALIIASLYFISYTTTVTNVANGFGWVGVLPSTILTVVNSTTGVNQTVTGFSFNATMLNATMLNATSSAPGSPSALNRNFSSTVEFVSNMTLTPINVTLSWEQLEKPYFYYGIAALIIGLVYPAFVLIDLLKNLRHKPKPQSTP
jgi:DNA-binding transcriptional ArsR family regulator